MLKIYLQNQQLTSSACPNPLFVAAIITQTKTIRASSTCHSHHLVICKTGNFSTSTTTAEGPRTMSRSAADATRFTATGPHASSKSGSVPYQLPGFAKTQQRDGNAAQPSTQQTQQPAETPKEKVRRLRAQHQAARMAQSASGTDRWIEVGRLVANKAHKGMVYTLIAASGKLVFPTTIYMYISGIHANSIR